MSESDKEHLLNALRRAHGSDEAPKKKITLTRKQTSEIKQADATGKARTIQVEVRKKRVFVKRDAPESQEVALAPEPDLSPEESAARLEEERQQQALLERQEAELREKQERLEREREREIQAAAEALAPRGNCASRTRTPRCARICSGRRGQGACSGRDGCSPGRGPPRQGSGRGPGAGTSRGGKRSG